MTTDRTYFFVTGLPRSRTAWLANLLTFGKSFCFHEGLAGHSSIQSYSDALHSVDRKYVGDADPSLAVFWPKINEQFPGARWVIVTRPIEEATSHFIQAIKQEPGLMDRLGANESAITDWIRKADQSISELVSSIDYQYVRIIEARHLDSEAAVKSIWSFCTHDPEGETWDQIRWNQLKNMRVTKIMSNLATPEVIAALTELRSKESV